jgi:hypothetical protein
VEQSWQKRGAPCGGDDNCNNVECKYLEEAVQLQLVFNRPEDTTYFVERGLRAINYVRWGIHLKYHNKLRIIQAAGPPVHANYKQETHAQHAVAGLQHQNAYSTL